MATSARLDELKKKFDESPRRYFAPLANEFRKLGDLTQAIAICRAHLPNQPGHVSGHIVLAQALYEARELGESRLAFEGALDLDPENLIALRYLGDIAREEGAPDLARSWYERVLDADPRNDEIATMLAALPPAREGSVALREAPAVDLPAEADPADSAYAADAEPQDAEPQDVAEPFLAFDPPAVPEPSAVFAPSATPTISSTDAESEGEFDLLDSLEPHASAPVPVAVEASALSFDLVDEGEAPATPTPVANAALPDRFTESFDVVDAAPPPHESAISLGDLEAIAEPSDDWFEHPAEPVSEVMTAELPDEQFLPDLKSITPAANPAVVVPTLELDSFASSMALPADAGMDEGVDHDFDASPLAELPASPVEEEVDATPVALEAFASEAQAEESRIEESADAPADSLPTAAPAAPAPPSLSFNPWAVTPSLDPVPAIAPQPWAFAGESAHSAEETKPVAPSESTADAVEQEERIAEINGAQSEWEGEGEAALESPPAEGTYARTPEWVAPVSEPAPAPFINETMAELYVKQGFVVEALAIYRQLLEQSPDDESLRDRIEALERVGTAGAPTPEQPVAPRVDPLGQSARSFFAFFARREPRSSAQATPVSVNAHPPRTDADGPASGQWGERFNGVATTAEALTTPDVAAPRVADSRVADSLESLFGDAGVSHGDSSAAGTLAAAFSAESQRGSAGSTPAQPKNSGEELSLQHLFGEVDARSSGAVSLDEFFSGGRSGSEVPSEGDPPAGAERADIEQFTAWLEGLKKK